MGLEWVSIYWFTCSYASAVLKERICSVSLDEKLREWHNYMFSETTSVKIKIFWNVYDHKTSTLTFDTHAAPDTFPASPTPSHFHPISLHFLLILKSIAAPSALSVWNSVTQNLFFNFFYFFWGKNFKLQPGAESPHFTLDNDGNKWMRSVWQHYLQRLSKRNQVWTKSNHGSSSFRGTPERSPKLAPSVCSVVVMKLSVGVGLL